MDFLVESRVKHPVYGEGVVLSVSNKPSSVTYPSKSNGRTRYKGNLNLGVRFDNGGPQGWASRSSNDPAELEPVQ